MQEKKNKIKNFNQKLYTFLFKLKLYFLSKASNHMSSQHDHVINLDYQS